jgi:ABC-type phosphate/phosphonate transport system permease subunit
MPSSKNALRRLLIVVAVVVGVLVYAYGWRVTDISLEETQDEVRQSSVTRALRELLSPNIFEQDREAEYATANVGLECQDDAPVEQDEIVDGEPYVVLTPACGSAGEFITVEGFGFASHADAFLRWIPPTGQTRPLVRTDIDGSGRFSTQFEIPRVRGGDGEIHQLEVEGSWPVGLPYFSDTTNTVIEKILETIFLALMATTIAVPIAAVLSFLSARNLMRQVRMPLGNVLVGFILLPVGWVLGTALLAPLADLAVDWGKELWLGLIGAAVVIGGYALAMRYGARFELEFGSPGYHARKIGSNVLLLTVTVFIFGVLGGLGIWLGSQFLGSSLADSFRLEVDWFNIAPVHDMGNFVSVLGMLVEMIVGLVAGLGGAFFVSSLGTDLTRDYLKRISGSSGHIAGGVLGAIGGVILFVGLGAVANLAAFLALLLPIIAAIFGSQLLVMLHNRVFRGGLARPRLHEGLDAVRLLVAVSGALIAFAVTFLYLNTSRGLVDGRLPTTIVWDVLGFSVSEHLFKAGLIGAVLGGVGGALGGTQAVFPLGMTVYNTARTILNALRSIEPLIMGIVFVIWVGIGPFAGVLALTLHSIAALGKLYSEQTENIDEGPLEAIQATGANRLQTIIYAVVPQIVPPYIAFTMYRWDINVRMSTIIGFVGGGGISVAAAN